MFGRQNGFLSGALLWITAPALAAAWACDGPTGPDHAPIAQLIYRSISKHDPGKGVLTCTATDSGGDLADLVIEGSYTTNINTVITADSASVTADVEGMPQGVHEFACLATDLAGLADTSTVAVPIASGPR